MNCLECKKEVVQIPGKRAKKFCSTTCRSNHWQKMNRKSAKVIDPAAIQKMIKEEREKIKDKPILYEPMKEIIQEASIENANLGLQAMIAAVKAEKIPANRDTVLGRKSWALDQKKRIKELEDNLKNQ